MPQAAAVKTLRSPKRAKPAVSNRRIGDALLIAKEQGLLSGPRTQTIRGRMPALLIEEAKKKTGIESDSQLIEAALAHIVAEDNYGLWLLSQLGTVSKDIDLEF